MEATHIWDWCARRCARDRPASTQSSPPPANMKRENPSASSPLAEGPGPPSRFRRPMLYPTELQARAGILRGYRAGIKTLRCCKEAKGRDNTLAETFLRRGQCQFDCSFGAALGGTCCRALTLRAPVAPGSLGSPPGNDARARPGTRLLGAGSAKCPAFATGAPPGRSWLRWVRSSKVLPRGLAGSRHLARAPREPCAPPPESRRARPARQLHGGDRR